MIRRVGWTAVLLLLVGVLAVSTCPAREAMNVRQSEVGGETPPRPTAPILVETHRVRPGKLTIAISASGTAEASRSLDVTAAVEGVLRDVLVGEGERVQSGDALAVLDDLPMRLDRDRAREHVVAALSRFAEMKLSFGSPSADGAVGAISNVVGTDATGGEGFLLDLIPIHVFRSILADPELEEVLSTTTRAEIVAGQVSLVAARVALVEAEVRLARARVVAPFDGRIGRTAAVAGQRVSAGSVLMRLIDADPIKVRAQILESEISQVSVGSRADVVFAAHPDRTFSGSVESFSPTVNAETRTLDAFVTIPNQDGTVRPGMYARVTLAAEIVEDILIVPSAAVLVRDRRPLVFVVRDGRAEWLHVRRGRESQEWVEILDGLSAGDEVITSGHFTLAHGTPVQSEGR